LINQCQRTPMQYVNKGIGANAISPRSPGYAASRKPSALERYAEDVIAQKPDLFILCYGLNDMRAGMPLNDFIDDMRTIVTDVRNACAPLIILTTIYYMTGWKSYPPYDRGSVALTEEFNRAIKALAEEQQCLVADVWDAEGQADWLIHPDGVHANKVGNILIANRVFETIAKNASALSNSVHERDLPGRVAQELIRVRESQGDPYRAWWQKH
ncbi:MAG TPA: SGNH/GDSL hydrolase family protein, partial [Candidatus Latescibacteria bacterium]|nr:SGNH/GDSL hydrolase family protein [Candidatus Latescibacterota bacterium]